MVNIYFHELYIGFPKNSDLVGGYLTNHNANNLAEQLFTQAEALTDVFQSINPNSDEFDLRDYFYSKLEELIQANGGGLSTSPPLGWTGTLKTHKTYLVSQSLECD